MNHPTEVVAEEFHHLKSQLEANEFVNNKLAELREENRGLKSANILLQRELESLKGDASSDSQKSDDLPEIIFEKKRSFSNGSSESDTCDDFVYNYNFHVAIWKARRQEAESIIKTILEDVLAEVVKDLCIKKVVKFHWSPHLLHQVSTTRQISQGWVLDLVREYDTEADSVKLRLLEMKANLIITPDVRETGHSNLGCPGLKYQPQKL